MDSIDGEIDYIDLSLTVTTPTSFTELTLEISDGTIGTPAVYALFYKLNFIPMDIGCVIKITGPPEVNMASNF